MDKREIYRSIILDNSTKPNKLVTSVPTGYEFINTDTTSCADDYKIYLKLENNIIKDVVFTGDGCSISKSTINIFANYLVNKTKKEALDFINNYKQMIKGETFNKEELKNLIAFEGVNHQLNRVACAMTGPNAIIKILENHEKD